MYASIRLAEKIDKVYTVKMTVRELRNGKREAEIDSMYIAYDTNVIKEEKVSDVLTPTRISKEIPIGNTPNTSRISVGDMLRGVKDNSEVLFISPDSERFVLFDDSDGEIKETYYQWQKQLNADNASWNIKVDKEFKANENDPDEMLLMKSPIVLQMVSSAGVGEIRFSNEKVHQIIQKHSGEVTFESFRDLPKLIANPVMVFKSSETSSNPNALVVVIETQGVNGASLLVPISLTQRQDEKGINYYMASSLYTQSKDRKHARKTANPGKYNKWVKDGLLLYVDRRQFEKWRKINAVDFVIGEKSHSQEERQDSSHEIIQENEGTTSANYWVRVPSKGKTDSSPINIVKTEADLVNERQWRGNVFYQHASDSFRGSIGLPSRFGENSPIKITLTPNADASTTIHELSHFFLWETEKLSQQLPGDFSLQADLNTLKNWLGWEDRQTGWTRDQQEKFASTFEAYLRDGKAPSQELVSVFARFKKWLCDIYKSIKELGITEQLSEEVRGVFDRMVATDEQIEEAFMLREGRAEQAKSDILAKAVGDIDTVRKTKRRKSPFRSKHKTKA